MNGNQSLGRLSLRGAALVLLFPAGLVACQSAQPDSPIDSKIETECREPRPEICTQEYRPVCGLRNTGSRCITARCPAVEWRTYSNACHACGDPEVVGYREGACPESGKNREKSSVPQ